MNTFTAYVQQHATTRIIGVGIFYRNNLPGGAGLQIYDRGDDDLDATIHQWEQEADRLYTEASDTSSHIAMLRDELAAYCKLKPQDREGLAPCFFGCVYTLTKHGLMPDDEFNGIVYGRELVKR